MFSNGGKRRHKPKGIHFEIIPMIDVMMILVLFLSVMAFLPQVQSSISVDPPDSGSSEEVTADDIMLTIEAGGGISVGDKVGLSDAEVIPAIQEMMGNDTDRRVVINADRGLQYEAIVKWLSELQKAKIGNVALATSKEGQ